MFGIMLHVQMNGHTLVSYNISTLRGNDLATKTAERLKFLGVENLYPAEFEILVTGKEVLAAEKLAGSNDTSLRTPATIVHFQQIPAKPKSPQPMFQYASTLLEKKV